MSEWLQQRFKRCVSDGERRPEGFTCHARTPLVRERLRGGASPAEEGGGAAAIVQLDQRRSSRPGPTTKMLTGLRALKHVLCKPPASDRLSTTSKSRTERRGTLTERRRKLNPGHFSFKNRGIQASARVHRPALPSARQMASRLAESPTNQVATFQNNRFFRQLESRTLQGQFTGATARGSQSEAWGCLMKERRDQFDHGLHPPSTPTTADGDVRDTTKPNDTNNPFITDPLALIGIPSGQPLPRRRLHGENSFIDSTFHTNF